MTLPPAARLPVRVLAGAVAVLLVASACGDESSGTSSDDASDGSDVDVVATVDGVDVSRAQLDDELATLVGNEAFVAVADRQGSPLVDDAGQPSDGIRAAWLTNLVGQAIIDAEFERRGLETDDDVRAGARAELDGRFGGPDVLGGFPAEYVDELVERNARLEVLLADLGGPPPTGDDVREYYEENRQDIAASCPSGLDVAHILVETAAEADDVVAELASGSEFAALARERSVDPGSGERGGELGCYRPGSFVEPFEAAVEGATPGEPTEPVESEFGWHVVLVGDDPTSFESMEPQLEAQLEGEWRSRASTALDELVGEAEVGVDPAVGEWVVDESGARVQPPAAETEGG